MAETARLQLRMPLATARGAVAATLSDQGFVVHRRGDGLEVERASVIGGASAGEPVRFPVRFSQDGEGTEVEFVIEPATEPGAARVIVAAARVAADRLAERESAWTIDASADHALPARATPEPDGSVSAAPEQHGPTMETAPEAAASSPAADVREHDGSVPGDDAAATADRPASTSTLAILALILAFVAPVGGIVTGVVALVRLRNTRERGRGVATAGIVIGVVMALLVPAAVLAGAALVVEAATEAHSDPTAGILGTPSPALTPAPMSSMTAFVPAVGQCFTQRGRGEIGEGNAVACDVPHAYEVYARFALEGDAYPGDTAVAERAQAGCVDAFATFVGRLYEESVLDDVYVSPTPKTWARGDRSVMCLVTDPAAATTGSLYGAAR